MARSWTDQETDGGELLSCSCCWGREPITRRALEALGRVVQAVRRG